MYYTLTLHKSVNLQLFYYLQSYIMYIIQHNNIIIIVTMFPWKTNMCIFNNDASKPCLVFKLIQSCYHNNALTISRLAYINLRVGILSNIRYRSLIVSSRSCRFVFLCNLQDDGCKEIVADRSTQLEGSQDFDDWLKVSGRLVISKTDGENVHFQSPNV